MGKIPPVLPSKIQAISQLTRNGQLSNEHTKNFVGITIMNKIYLICTAILGVSKIEMSEDISGRFTDWKTENLTHIFLLNNNT